MQFSERKHPLVVIVGPTAVGKTEFSITLARHLNGEIISADSRSFYKGMELGTAKPSEQERSMVPHHMLDICLPDCVFSLAEFQTLTGRIISEIHAREKLPFLVGGTGQYIRCVIEGWKIPPQPPLPNLRTVLTAWGDRIGAEELHRKLTVLDPVAAEFVDSRNMRRTVRALEVILTTGRLFSELRTKSPPAYDTLIVGLTRPRADLYHRIDLRIDKIINDGLADEVAGLLAQGYDPDLPSFSAIGYREMVQVLRDEISLEAAREAMKQRTRIFVRRQANWFKETDPLIHWFDLNVFKASEVEEFIRQHFEHEKSQDGEE